MKKIITLLVILLTTIYSYSQDYSYEAKIIDVYDGDTVTAVINLGFNISITEKIRLLNINAPEIKGTTKMAGIVSRNVLRDKVLNKTVILKTKKDKKGKYGRYLGELFFDDVNINDWLVKNGYAIYQEY